MTYIETLQAAQRRRKKILALFNQGLKQVDIAKQIGITPQRVNKVIRENGQGKARKARTNRKPPT